MNERTDQTTHWQPIDTAPTDGSRFLFWNGEIVGIGMYFGRARIFGADSFGGKTAHNPTHWMPLPEPPL